MGFVGSGMYSRNAHIFSRSSRKVFENNTAAGTKKTSPVFFLFPLLFYVRKKYENIPNFLPLIPVF